MANPNPTLFERVCENLLVIFVVLPYLTYHSIKAYVKSKTNPKLKHMNWLGNWQAFRPNNQLLTANFVLL